MAMMYKALYSAALIFLLLGIIPPVDSVCKDFFAVVSILSDMPLKVLEITNKQMEEFNSTLTVYYDSSSPQVLSENILSRIIFREIDKKNANRSRFEEIFQLAAESQKAYFEFGIFFLSLKKSLYEQEFVAVHIYDGEKVGCSVGFSSQMFCFPQSLFETHMDTGFSYTELKKSFLNKYPLFYYTIQDITALSFQQISIELSRLDPHVFYIDISPQKYKEKEYLRKIEYALKADNRQSYNQIAAKAISSGSQA